MFWSQFSFYLLDFFKLNFFEENFGCYLLIWVQTHHYFLIDHSFVGINSKSEGWHFVPLFWGDILSHSVMFLVFLYFVTFCVTCHSSLGLTVIFFRTFCQAKFKGKFLKLQLLLFLAFFLKRWITYEMNHSNLINLDPVDSQGFFLFFRFVLKFIF